MQLEYWAPSLRKQTPITILFPDRIENRGPYPVFYLLHGLSDSNTVWTRMTSLERYTERLPLIVVMPDGQRSFYCDSATGQRFDEFIAQDLPALIQRFFHVRDDRAGRCIGGLSMGGYGAIKMALKYPDRYVSATGHSGAYFRDFNQIRDDLHNELALHFGGPTLREEDNVFSLAQKNANASLPALRFDCGVDDFLIENNRDLDRHLAQLGIAHEYEEFPGAHSWRYWDEHIQEALTFHCRHLGIEPEPVKRPFAPPQE